MASQQLFLNDIEVAERYGKHRSWTWRQIKLDPKFPKALKLSRGCTRWKLKDLEAWEDEKMVA